MKILTLSSGSQGNCYLLETETSILILECGVKINDIIINLKFDKKIVCIYSHEDKDHSLSADKLKISGVDVWGKHNLKHNQQKELGEWVILPIEMPHGNTTSFNFIIYNKAERKHIFFATDCSELPKIAERRFDCMLLETNYDIDVLLSRADSIENKGYLNHLSIQSVEQWLSSRQSRVGTILLCHLSNSGNLNLQGLESRFSPFAENVYIATKGKEIIC